ncbi:KRAB [Mytilus edulis]|uniref:KRAB n=1 Tax=Mytilus edulis TaxID=6550 RepID=A0A8S3VH76_MYTED|nr:KRAB [Mytilus edulis]
MYMHCSYMYTIGYAINAGKDAEDTVIETTTGNSLSTDAEITMIKTTTGNRGTDAEDTVIKTTTGNSPTRMQKTYSTFAWSSNYTKEELQIIMSEESWRIKLRKILNSQLVLHQQVNMKTAKDRNRDLKQIENACENLTSENDDFMFVTMNTDSKTSHCVGTQIGMDFLNQQLMVDSGESSILKMFSKFVQDGENEENEIKDDEEEDLEVDGDESDTKEDNDTGENTKPSTGRWSCGVCNAKAKKCWLVRRHMRRMHDLDNDDFKPCRHCRRVLANEECNRCLVKEEKNFMCDTCGSVFTTKAQLSRHEEVHLTEKEVPCPLCNKKFKTERYVKMHVYNTHKKRYGKALSAQTEPGICDICGKWFRFKCNAVRHREIHFEEKKFDCSICQMKFRHSSSLKRHMMSHQQKSDNMYVCEQCGRSFKMRQTLLQHHRVHVKQPFLKCEYCPRSSLTYKGKKYHILKDHIDKAGEFSFKSYICEHCGKPSSSQNEYEEHLKNHDESRTHVCSICGTRWETVAQLKAHKKKHNVTPFRYRCKVCNIPFKEASKVRAHIQKDSHFKNCAAKGLDRTIDKVSDLTNTEIVEIIEYDYDLNFHSEEDLQLEIEANTTAQIHEMPDEIKVIHIEQNEFDVTGGQTVQILNEEGVEIMYDEISLPQEEITVDGNQVIYQVEIDGQNAIICDTLTSQAVESILKLQSQA